MEWLGRLPVHEAPDGSTGPANAGFVEPLEGVTLIAVTSLDGRATVDGVSGGLGNPADAAVFGSLRSVSDVVIVGAGTTREEDYGPATPPTRIAVLTRSLSLDPTARLFSDPSNPPLIIGGSDASPERREAVSEAGGHLLELAETDPHTVVDALRRRGHSRITVEGGPSLYRDFLSADVVDRIFLTLSPMVVGGGAATFASDSLSSPRGDGKLLDSGFPAPRRFRAEAAAFFDSHLFVRYSRGPAG